MYTHDLMNELFTFSFDARTYFQHEHSVPSLIFPILKQTKNIDSPMWVSNECLPCTVMWRKCLPPIDLHLSHLSVSERQNSPNISLKQDHQMYFLNEVFIVKGEKIQNLHNLFSYLLHCSQSVLLSVIYSWVETK